MRKTDKGEIERDYPARRKEGGGGGNGMLEIRSRGNRRGTVKGSRVGKGRMEEDDGEDAAGGRRRSAVLGDRPPHPHPP